MPRKSFTIEIRDQRLRGGRLLISARSASKVEWRKREAAVRALMDGGHLDLVERLRKRGDKLHIADIAKAVAEGKIDELRTLGQDASPLTLQAGVDRLLKTVKATNAEATHTQYRILCDALVDKFGPDTLLTDITTDQLRDWLHEPKATAGNQPWAGSRQTLARAVIGLVFKRAIAAEEELSDRLKTRARITKNPRRNLEVAASNKRVEFLRPAEWRNLSEKCAGRAVHALVGLCTLAGLRQQEAAHIRKDIDIEDLRGSRPRLHIQPHSGEWAWNPKGYPRHKRSCRVVPICEELRTILIAHIESGFAGEVYLLKTPTGPDRPLSHQPATEWTRAAFVAAGIRYGRKKDALTLHSLRHTFISWLVQKNVSLKVIEQLAGTSVKMILEVYGHLMDTNLDEAISLIDSTVRS